MRGIYFSDVKYMKKIIAIILSACILLTFSLTAFAASDTDSAVISLSRYYKNNASAEKNIYEVTSLAYLYRPMPAVYYEGKQESHTYTKAEIEATDDPALTAAELIIFAATTNIKITELAKDFKPVDIIIAAQNDSGLYSDSLYKSAVCLAALLAVSTDDEITNPTISALLNSMLPDRSGWSSDGSETVDYELTFFILSVLSGKRIRADVGNAYLSVREKFLLVLNDNGEVIINNVSRPDVAAMAIACANDYKVDDVTDDSWKGIYSSLLSLQHEDGYFTDASGNIDEKLTALALHAVTSEYFNQSGIGRLVEGRGYVNGDFSEITVMAVTITLVLVLIIFGIIFIAYTMHKGKKERLEG